MCRSVTLTVCLSRKPFETAPGDVAVEACPSPAGVASGEVTPGSTGRAGAADRDLVGAKVAGDDRWVVADFPGRSFGDHPPELHGVNPVTELHEHRHIVLNDHDGAAQLVANP